jgi:carboxylesterase type B
VVETEDGKVEGLNIKTPHHLFGHQVEQFLGIPFAAPPTGQNRFRPPQPLQNYGYRKATKLAPICHQLDMATNFFIGKEDCLYLNVYRPAGATPASKLPVFVWIYGGAFWFGDGSELGFYDGTNVAERHGHIIVTFNYRLFALGFLALPEIAAENNGTAGNQGLQDQRAALQWVQRNIHAFGGDPAQVTLAGESAGAMSVGSHIVSPESKGLFRSAIMESGDLRADYYWYPRLSEAYKAHEAFADKVGCPSGPNRLACLRNLPEKDIALPCTKWVADWFPELQNYHPEYFGQGHPLPKDLPSVASPGYPATPFGPVIDGSPAGLPDDPMKLLRSGKFNKVPLIIGTNRDGGSYIGVATPLAYGAFPLLDNDLDKMARWLFTNKTDQDRLLQLYNGQGGFWRKRITFGRVFRDSFFQCSTRDIATEISRHGLPVYHYVFDFKGFGFLDKVFHIGASHVFEIPFVFRTHIDGLADVFNFFGKDKWWKMADMTSCTWASFVKCQKPKCPSDPPPNCAEPYRIMPEWTPFSEPDNRNYLRLDLTPEMKTIMATAPIDNEFAGDDKCDFWKSAHYEWHDPHDFWQDSNTLVAHAQAATHTLTWPAKTTDHGYPVVPSSFLEGICVQTHVDVLALDSLAGMLGKLNEHNVQPKFMQNTTCQGLGYVCKGTAKKTCDSLADLCEDEVNDVLAATICEPFRVVCELSYKGGTTMSDLSFCGDEGKKGSNILVV